MRPISRSGVNKNKSAKTFRAHAKQTKYANIRPGPMRGGIRL